MKALEITDDWGTDSILMCEMHFKKHYKKIAAASQKRVSIIISDTKEKGCIFCLADREGLSPWSGTAFKIWRGYKSWEKDNESR